VNISQTTLETPVNFCKMISQNEVGGL